MVFNMIVHNKMGRAFIGPKNIKVDSRGWVDLTAEQHELWQKHPVVMGLVEQNCLEFVRSQGQVKDAAETVDTAPIEAPETLKKDASVESRGTAEVAIKKGGAK